MSRRQNKLIGKFKIAVDDVVSIVALVVKYTHIPTGIKRVLVRSWCGLQPEELNCWDCWRMNDDYSF